MDDRTLLERAAKAYWGEEIGDVVSVERSEPDQAIAFTHGENQDHNGNDCTLIWNPLADDGDALRLAVKLHIDIRHFMYERGFMDCLVDRIGKGFQEAIGDDPYAATRRAIVRAAAAMEGSGE